MEFMSKPSIKTFQKTVLVGKRLKMSLAMNRTKELWQEFMKQRSDIKNRVDPEFYSVEVYPDSTFFKNFDPHNEFEKWAAVKVRDHDTIPKEMEALTIPQGLYAVFLYKGKASDAPKAYQYIFGTWLPMADYTLDDRPHFAIMGEKYKNEDPSSEEELWIPVKKK
ncbi:GyrI-like domain-containing protein [Sungkyunkwania multivorans]|uniref:GyrI-like domain-containing protein n=1 Tax=Sungkyunkwania multivorans TaxID=1173618 RepID=A0ABW3CY11_9FLAO